MTYVIRPTAAVAIVAITIYVLVFYRPWFLRYVGWALVVGVPWLVFNFAIYGALLPPYYAASRMDSPSFSALLGVLFSPSRGLLIFTPVVLFAVSGFVPSLRERAQRPLHIAFAGIVVGITCIVVSWEGWSGGHCFGPRLMTDVVPFLVYFVMFNFHLPARQPVGEPVPFGQHCNFRRPWRSDSCPGRVAVWTMAMELHSQLHRYLAYLGLDGPTISPGTGPTVIPISLSPSLS